MPRSPSPRTPADHRIERDPTRVTFCGAQMGYARTVRAGGFLFLSGHTAVDAQGHVGLGDIRTQALLTFEKIKATLAQAGCTLDDVVKTTVYLADPRDFWVMNQIFNEVFPEHPPARTTVIAQPVLDTRIEIDVVAFRTPLPDSMRIDQS